MIRLKILKVISIYLQSKKGPGANLIYTKPSMIIERTSIAQNIVLDKNIMVLQLLFPRILSVNYKCIFLYLFHLLDGPGMFKITLTIAFYLIIS
jgi:hypothetical protein